MDTFAQILVNGTVSAAFLILIAVGLTFIFGIMHILNFAHGELYMLGAYGVWFLYSVHSFPFFGAVLSAMVAGAALCLAFERGLFRQQRNNEFGGLTISIALMLILQVGVARAWGVGLMKPVYAPIKGALVFGGISVGWQRLVIIPAAIILLVLLWFLLNRMNVGRALRASAQDKEAAVLQGINLNTMGAVAWGLGGAFAGVAGALMAPLVAVNPYMGHAIILKAFIVVIVGGLGSVKGAIIAGVMFAFLDTTVATLADGSMAQLAGVLALLFVLAIRPLGIAGHEG